MPAGTDVTVPDPSPDFSTVREWLTVASPKFAITDWAAVIVRVQAPVPEHGPLHPVNVDPLAGVALSVTTVPAA
jgi:hypothetical protein